MKKKWRGERGKERQREEGRTVGERWRGRISRKGEGGERTERKTDRQRETKRGNRDREVEKREGWTEKQTERQAEGRQADRERRRGGRQVVLYEMTQSTVGRTSQVTLPCSSLDSLRTWNHAGVTELQGNDWHSDTILSVGHLAWHCSANIGHRVRHTEEKARAECQYRLVSIQFHSFTAYLARFKASS